ncbi:hypothetical protein H4R35_000858 [Dimargaris xerosporica]|nr:hypothetical protein H4R35_000858 [Dimargaris xerosporica]
MDFTVQYRQQGHQLQYSPDGQYLAHSHKERLVVRRCEDLEILHTFTCSYPIQDIQWNPHSDYILTASYSRTHKVDVRCLSDPQWRAEIDESYVGLASARWSRDGAHVLTVAEFQLRLSIWSLLNGEVFYIQNPKYKDKGNYSPDGRFVAVAERHDSKDAVGVYSTDPWTLQKVGFDR